MGYYGQIFVDFNYIFSINTLANMYAKTLKLVLIGLLLALKPMSIAQAQPQPDARIESAAQLLQQIDSIRHHFLHFLGLQYGIPAMAHADSNAAVRIPDGLFLMSDDAYNSFWTTTPFVEVDLDGSGRKHRLQTHVAEQLKLAIADLKAAGIPFKIRGADGVFRSYADAREIWLARIKRELDHHRGQRPTTDTLDHSLLRTIEQLGAEGRYIDQAALIYWQETHLPKPMMFGKLHQGPLYASCAAPGTSHHTLGIAIDLDIATLRHTKSLQIMAKHGFFRCIVSDFAHFAYLGAQFGQAETLKQQNLRWIKHADGARYLKYDGEKL